MDISVKIAIGLGTAFAGAAAIIVPGDNQKEAAALDLFDKPLQRCTPQERRAAEFKAGHKRWEEFAGKVYSVTRKLPGAQTPILNPYKGPRQMPAHLQQQQQQQEQGQAS